MREDADAHERLLNKWLCSPELPSLVAKGEAQTLEVTSGYGGICFAGCIFNKKSYRNSCSVYRVSVDAHRRVYSDVKAVG